ncbi:PA2779 family protein [Paraglaciecola aquimarina]|uniref:PA2779 family protein n=1 Tax=Paraglaciecola algarum TaxID=3050085 RepID=A0ABS9D511_9ALTE|nr:PA2779 family protein [Paraglaciecola sp. G1-23]MCF2948016.1 PA2779 family protein [Paraglaciecola sp. G1-23]
MKFIKVLTLASLFFVINTSFVSAKVVTSESVMQIQNTTYQKQQILKMVNTTAVQDKLVQLGVTEEDAVSRINNMTPEEIQALNTQLNEAPAGGIVGTVVTVLVVVAVLDLMGLTDVYPFIRPI